jgi:DNA polymerase-3 subunit delta'
MRFDLIQGQDGPISILNKALQSGRVPTAYLFTGPPGCGRMTTALATAASLNCASGPPSCGICPSCRLYAAGNHPDLHLIAPVQGKRIIVIEQVREQILGRAYLKPMNGATSTFIVDDAHLMNANAANAFLKTLEEPPVASHFILIAPDRDSVLPTIASRCQILSFRPLSRKVLEGLLLRKGIESMDAGLLAAMARGSMERALDYHSGEALQSMAEEFEPLTSLNDQGSGRLLDLSQRWGKNREEALKVLEFMAQWYRDILVLAEGTDEDQVIHTAHIPTLKEAAGRMSGPCLAAVLESVQDAREALESNANVQLTLDNLLLKVRAQTTLTEKRA